MYTKILGCLWRIPLLFYQCQPLPGCLCAINLSGSYKFNLDTLFQVTGHWPDRRIQLIYWSTSTACLSVGLVNQFKQKIDGDLWGGNFDKIIFYSVIWSSHYSLNIHIGIIIIDVIHEIYLTLAGLTY